MSAASRSGAGAAEVPAPGSTVAVALGAAAVETCLVAAVLAGGHALSPAVALHAAVVLVLAIWLRRLARAGRDLRFPILLLSTTAVLGPVGGAGVILTLALNRWYARSARTFDQWYAALFPEEARGAFDAVSGRLSGIRDGDWRNTDVVPFMDILTFGSRQQKQSLIALIASRFQPAFAPVLRRALHDGNNAVRVQAATAMTMVENAFLERSMSLTEAAGASPREASKVLELARHYDSYAFAGILDEQRERQNRELATQTYRKYLVLRPQDGEATAELGRILVRGGRFAEAVAFLGETLHRGEPSARLVVWCMESLFSLRRYDELSNLARTYRDVVEADTSCPPEIGELVRLWASREAPPRPQEVP